MTPEPDENTRLRAALTETRLRYAFLLAAARSTLAADRDGEPDPLYYLRDELSANPSLPPYSDAR
ncbi:hypothetical protein [Cryptosporangium aurantiacum]|uniref:Uncharacterized protein n=1 Tax=Cryptosporangium aurantiacum TaxID=134849 RepID=A0A1M7RKT1_9ACTN|nr:hypothetical protein [Cryptosporangium aurantiacum]SHN46923.1 hypothetical protein SAMN05443668_11918 [Cryptosporangium aurantiacum]